MVEFHYNMINKTKDQLILEDIYSQQGYVYYTSDVPRTDILHWIAASLSLMFLLHNLHGKAMLVFVEVDVLMMLIGN